MNADLPTAPVNPLEISPCPLASADERVIAGFFRARLPQTSFPSSPAAQIDSFRGQGVDQLPPVRWVVRLYSGGDDPVRTSFRDDLPRIVCRDPSTHSRIPELYKGVRNPPASVPDWIDEGPAGSPNIATGHSGALRSAASFDPGLSLFKVSSCNSQ